MNKLHLAVLISFIFTASLAIDPYYYHVWEIPVDTPAPEKIPTFNVTGEPQEQEPKRHLPNYYYYSSPHYEPTLHECFVNACAQWTLDEFAQYFDSLLQNELTTPEQILGFYRLYEYPAFRMYLKKLPGYESHVTKLHKTIHACNKCRKKLVGTTGISQRELHHVICPMAKEVNECMRDRRKRELEQKQKEVSSQSYAISDETDQMLNELGLDPDKYRNFSGNMIQQIIHQGFVKIVNNAAQLRKNYGDKNILKEFSEITVEFADIGREYNAAGFERHARLVSNFCWASLKCIGNFTIGIGEGAVGKVSHAIMHPIVFTTDLVKSAENAAVGLLNLLLTLSDLQVSFELDPQMGLDKADEIGLKLTPVYRAIKKNCKELSARDWGRGVGGMAVEGFLQYRLLKTAGSFFKFAHKQCALLARENPGILNNKQLLLSHAEGVPAYIAEEASRLLGKDLSLSLTLQQDGTWISKGGLVYGKCKKFGNRAYHVLEHLRSDNTKRIHSVFSVPEYELFDLIDQAWLKKGNALVKDPRVYIVDMGKVIGTKGETAIRIVVEEPGSLIITSAYPVKI